MDQWHHHQICQRHIQLCQVSCFQVTFSSSKKKICSGSSRSTSCQVLLVIFVSHHSWIRFRSSEHFAPLLGSSGSTSAFMSSHVLYYESVSISDKYVSSSLSCIISHRTARLNERVYNLMIKFHPHLVMVFFQNQPGQEKEFKHSVTEFTVKPSFFIEALISSPHLDGLDQQASASAMQISSPSAFTPQQASSLMVKSAVINIR